MRVTLVYLAQVKRVAGAARETVELPPGGTVARLMEHLCERRTGAFREMLLDEQGRPRRTLLYAVNDEQADLSRELREGDEVAVLAPMAGG